MPKNAKTLKKFQISVLTFVTKRDFNMYITYPEVENQNQNCTNPNKCIHIGQIYTQNFIIVCSKCIYMPHRALISGNEIKRIWYWPEDSVIDLYAHKSKECSCFFTILLWTVSIIEVHERFYMCLYSQVYGHEVCIFKI